MAKIETVGSKVKVFHGTAKHTPGGLVKKDLKKTSEGHIVSKKASAASKIKYRENGLKPATAKELAALRRRR